MLSTLAGCILQHKLAPQIECGKAILSLQEVHYAIFSPAHGGSKVNHVRCLIKRQYTLLEMKSLQEGMRKAEGQLQK